MISRKSTLALADLITLTFYDRADYNDVYGRPHRKYKVETDSLYDFLYEHNYEAWFCNLVRAASGSGSSVEYATRRLKDLILQLHTGESIVSATLQWSWDQRSRLGNQLLQNLAEDMLIKFSTPQNLVDALTRALELDGYKFLDRHLLAPETDILDVRQEQGVLDQLYSALTLGKKDVAFHHLELSEQHYTGNKWDDSISNSRKFLECVLEQCAIQFAVKLHPPLVREHDLSSPATVRAFLRSSCLIEKRECDALASVYGLLSHTGGHPYMAQSDQARLLRHLALTFSQFVMLRLQGALDQQAPN